MDKRELLTELGFESSVVFEDPNFDESIIGVDTNDRVVYDYDSMVEELMQKDNMSYEDAVEFIDYNTIRSLPYVQNSPTVVYGFGMMSRNKEAEFNLNTKESVTKITEKCVDWIREWFEKNGKGCNAVIGMSGGKDSTIVAALCCKALGPDRVIGVALPDEGQGINNADKICEHFGMKYYCVPIDGITNAFNFSFNFDGKKKMSEQTSQNIPPRVRMTMLYAIAQSMNGRVANTCNLSEDYIGYSTLFGDSAGSFAPIANFTVTELKKIGRELGIPVEWVDKTPDDGLPHSRPDEEKFGFSYATLDTYIRGGIIDGETADKIATMHKNNKFKTDIIRIPSFNPYVYAL